MTTTITTQNIPENLVEEKVSSKSKIQYSKFKLIGLAVMIIATGHFVHMALNIDDTYQVDMDTPEMMVPTMPSSFDVKTLSQNVDTKIIPTLKTNSGTTEIENLIETSKQNTLAKPDPNDSKNITIEKIKEIRNVNKHEKINVSRKMT